MQLCKFNERERRWAAMMCATGDDDDNNDVGVDQRAGFNRTRATSSGGRRMSGFLSRTSSRKKLQRLSGWFRRPCVCACLFGCDLSTCSPHFHLACDWGLLLTFRPLACDVIGIHDDAHSCIRRLAKLVRALGARMLVRRWRLYEACGASVRHCTTSCTKQKPAWLSCGVC